MQKKEVETVCPASRKEWRQYAAIGISPIYKDNK